MHPGSFLSFQSNSFVQINDEKVIKVENHAQIYLVQLHVKNIKCCFLPCRVNRTLVFGFHRNLVHFETVNFKNAGSGNYSFNAFSLFIFKWNTYTSPKHKGEEKHSHVTACSTRAWCEVGGVQGVKGSFQTALLKAVCSDWFVAERETDTVDSWIECKAHNHSFSLDFLFTFHV